MTEREEAALVDALAAMRGVRRWTGTVNQDPCVRRLQRALLRLAGMPTRGEIDTRGVPFDLRAAEGEYYECEEYAWEIKRWLPKLRARIVAWRGPVEALGDLARDA